MGIQLYTPKFRAAFVNVFKPKPGKQRKDGSISDPSYELVAIFDAKFDRKPFDNAVIEAIIEKVKCDRAEAVKIAKHPKFKHPLKDQAEVVDKEGNLYAGFEEGLYCATLRNKMRPGLVNENVDDIIDAAEFKSGDYAVAQIEAFYFDHPEGGRGVSFSLLNLQRQGRGEPLGGQGVRAKPQDVFKPIPVEDAEDIFDN